MKTNLKLFAFALVGIALEVPLFFHQRSALGDPGRGTRVARPVQARKAPASAVETEIVAAPGGTTDELAAAAPTNPTAFNTHFRQALLEPAFRDGVLDLQKRSIRQHYDRLIASLGLSRDDEEKFVSYLAEKQSIKTDVAGVIFDNKQGANGAAIPLNAEAQQKTNAAIQELLGDAGYAQYYHFEMTDGLRTTVRQLQTVLQDSDSPLSDDQVESMVESLNDALPPEKQGGFSKFTGMSAAAAAGLTVVQAGAPLPQNALELMRGQLSHTQERELGKLLALQQDTSALRVLAQAAER